MAEDSISLRQAGFTLLQLSIILTVAALVFVSILPGQDAGDYNQKEIATTKKLEYVENAMRAFMAFNGRRPCPADGQYGVNTANFGKEAATPGTCTGGTPAAPMGPDVGTGYIVGGVIPTKSLNIPDDYAFDAWGRRFTYVVDKRATSALGCQTLEGITPSNYTPTGTGGVKIENTTGGTVLDNTIYAYISYGPDGHGAFPEQGSTVGNRINIGSTDQDENTNAGASNDGNMTYSTGNFTNVFVQKDKTSTFDHIVWYRSDLKNTCCVGKICIPYGFRIDGTVSGARVVVAGVADFNGDGIPDLLLVPTGGASTTAYVVFGTTTGFPNPLPLNTLNGTNGITITNGGGASFYSGAMGDINGDGYADVLLSRLSNTIYVLFGQPCGGPSLPACTTAFNAIFSASGAVDINAASDGVTRILLHDWAGKKLAYQSIPAIGNITGDTHTPPVNDIIFDGAASSGGAGYIYVIFGQQCGGPRIGKTYNGTTYAACSYTDIPGGVEPYSIDPDVAADGTRGFRVSDRASMGWYPHSFAVNVLSGKNGATIADLLIGEGQANSTIDVIYGNNAGSAYWSLVNGGTLGSLSATYGTYFYYSAVTWNKICCPAVGTVNGVNALLMGHPYFAGSAGANTGAIFIIPTSMLAWTAASYDVSAAILAGGIHPYYIYGPYANGYLETVTIGDLNGDGNNDMILGAPGNVGSASDGSIFVIYGNNSGTFVNRDLATTPLTGIDGFRIDCSYSQDQGYCGNYLHTADVNNDGVTDFIWSNLNGTSATGVTTAGYSYVLYGTKKAPWSNPFTLNTIY